MATAVDMKVIRKLSVDERIKLIEAILETIDDVEIPVSANAIAEAQRRLKWARANLDKCLTEEQFKALREHAK